MTTIHFSQTTENNVNVMVQSYVGGNIVTVTDMDVGHTVGIKTFPHLDQALAYANACVSGVPPHGTFATI